MHVLQQAWKASGGVVHAAPVTANKAVRKEGRHAAVDTLADRYQTVFCLWHQLYATLSSNFAVACWKEVAWHLEESNLACHPNVCCIRRCICIC